MPRTLILWVLIFWTKAVFSLDLILAPLIYEGGDDRWMLAYKAEVHSGFMALSWLQTTEEFGPVRTVANILTFDIFIPFIKGRNLYALFGPGIYRTDKSLSYQNPADAAYNDRETRLTIAGHMGLRWQNASPGPWLYGAIWESALIPAGIDATIFLATGRKQWVGGFVGYKW